MPLLVQSLQGYDLGHYNIIARLWGFDLQAGDARRALERLVALMLNEEAFRDCWRSLPERARQGLIVLARSGGRLPWGQFERQFGGIRAMGRARRDREQPYMDGQTSISEALWYRGLIARAFFDTPAGPKEFAYIPDDLLPLVPVLEADETVSLVRWAQPQEHVREILAGDRLLDDACTLLTALRLEQPRLGLPNSRGKGSSYFLVENPAFPYPLPWVVLKTLLQEAGIWREQKLPNAGEVRRFLEMNRGEALLRLMDAWRSSRIFDELRLVPGLLIESEVRYDPVAVRELILRLMVEVFRAQPQDQGIQAVPYWSLASFVETVQRRERDFLRSGGEYDSWYIRDKRSGALLTGTESWWSVEAALIRYLVAGPLYWFGVVDLGLAEVAGGEIADGVASFRISRWGRWLLQDQPPQDLPDETMAFRVSSTARVYVPWRTKRALRYQVARFGEWEGIKGEYYIYRLSPASLALARKQGLRMAHLKGILRRYANPIPPPVWNALERWERRGTEVSLESVTLLRVKDAALMNKLRQSAVGRYFGETLNDTTVVVLPGVKEKLRDSLVALGYLSSEHKEEERRSNPSPDSTGSTWPEKWSVSSEGDK